MPICELPAALEVNGPLAQALQLQDMPPPRPCLLSGPAASVLGVCELGSSSMTEHRQHTLHFVGCWRWHRRRLEQLVEQGLLGVASLTLGELLGDHAVLLPQLCERACFAS